MALLLKCDCITERHFVRNSEVHWNGIEMHSSASHLEENTFATGILNILNTTACKWRRQQKMQGATQVKQCPTSIVSWQTTDSGDKDAKMYGIITCKDDIYKQKRHCQVKDGPNFKKNCKYFKSFCWARGMSLGLNIGGERKAGTSGFCLHHFTCSCTST